MASETDRRSADFEEIKAALAQQQAIKMAHVEGEPPDCYEIEYRLTGLVRNADGTVRKASQHLVLISLPFGYPHFPPTVKPLTPIFHPDVDPDAVRIASHWQKQPSLAKLIFHIGDMISGGSYSLDDPFNQEAADWYSEHADELPLDSSAQPSDSAAELDLGLELDLGPVESEAAEQDSSFALALEIEEPLSAAPEPPRNIEHKLEELRAHVSKKEMTIASRLLAELSAVSGNAALEGIRRTVKAALEERDRLLQELKVVEDEDNFAAAEEILKKIKKVAVDTPDLAEIGRRLQQSKSMLDTFAVKKEALPAEQEVVPPAEEQKKKTAKKAKEPPPPPKQSEDKTPGRGKIVRRAARSSPVSPFSLIAISLAGTILGGGMLYTRDADKVRDAKRSWREVRYLAQQKKFGEAKLKAEDALDMLDSTLLPGLGQNGLEEEISILLESEEFRMGLEGKGIYKGQTLPLQEVEKRQELDRLTALSESLAKNGKLKESVVAFSEAWNFAAKNGFTAEAQTLEERKHQQEMKDALEELGRQLDQSLQEALKAFQRELEQAQQGFTDVQWQKVADMLGRALQMLDKNPVPGLQGKRQEIEQLHVKARLYQLLAVARQAYNKGDAAAAAIAYRQALQLLQDNQAAFGEEGARDAAEKISKTVSGIEIKIAQEAAELKKNLPAAVEHYKKLLDQLIAAGSSPQAVDSIKAKIKKLEAAADMSGKMRWLEQNFERIFRDAYPAASSSVLSSPTMALSGKINGLEVYTLGCIERGQGLSARLELKYLYNPATAQWSPYSGQ
jgi:ubiquitin-protein ligase/DNA-binding transcriptional regulator GbsR (MarR family)